MFGHRSKDSRAPGIVSQHRSYGGSRRRATRRLKVESLESRLLLHAEGLAWTSGPDLTISFASDGTEVAGQASSLFAELGTLQTRTWQDAVVRAFQTWAQYASTNVEVVADSGDPFGVAGPTQGDLRFGDVRIAAVPLSSDVIAMSVPLDEVISGTWAGDVLINSNAHFANVDELFSVMLHEAGHVFGLEHSDDPASPMFLHGVSQAVVPTARDVADVRQAHGTPVENEERDEGSDDERSDHEESDDEKGDEHEDREEDEQSPRSRTELAAAVQYVSADSDRMLHFASSGVIDSAQDVDAFRLIAGDVDADDFKFLTVTVRSAVFGGLLPTVEVYSTSGTKLEGQVLTNANGTFVLQVSGVKPEKSYIVCVSGADSTGSFQAGGYELEAQFVDERAKLEEYVAGTFSSEQPQAERSLHVNETTLAHFVLTAEPVRTDAEVALWAVIYDGAGGVVGQFAARAGESRSSGTLLLTPGDYRLELIAARPDGGPLPEVAFRLLGKTISLPIGPGIIDPTKVPMLPLPSVGGRVGDRLPPALAVTDPIIFPGPINLLHLPRPIVVSPPWSDPRWWYWRSVPIAGTFGGWSP